MSRIAQKQTISPKVYRHFAVITIVVTALIGFFANGENRDAATVAMAAVATEQPKPKPSAAPSQAVAFRSGRTHGSWGNDAGADAGSGVETISDEGLYTPGRTRPQNVQPPVPMSPAMQLGGLDNLPDTPPPGMPMQVYLQLKREKERLKKAGPQVATQADLARMAEQSRQRSGGEDLPVDQTD